MAKAFVVHTSPQEMDASNAVIPTACVKTACMIVHGQTDAWTDTKKIDISTL